QRARAGSSCLRISGEELSVHDHGAAVFAFVRLVRGLVGDVAHFAGGQKHAADGLGIGNGVDVAFIESQAKFAGGKYQPGDFLFGVDAVGADHARGEDEWRRAHARHTDALAAQVLHRPNVAVESRLHAQAATV